MPDLSARPEATPDGHADRHPERKMRHIRACLDFPVDYQTVRTGLDDVPWPYTAAANLDLASIDLSTTFLGHRLAAPVLIGAMTGGAELGATINRNLALAAQALGVGMMLGSQRVMLEHPEARASFLVRDFAPDVFLVGNLGLAQFAAGYGSAEARAAVREVGGDALAVHANPLQEAMQGAPARFTGSLDALARVCEAAPFPVIFKEVGHGLDAVSARRAAQAGVAALDVAGAGGTNWARVEAFARFGEVRHAQLAELGIPTADALRACRAATSLPLVGSGGIRTGLDAARALKLGASVVAVARPLLGPATESAEAVIAWLEGFLWELRVALFVGGYARASEVAPAGRDGRE
ncbi:MAG TPA: type 2 isopentenyl-diphosphate Delta-isomerase [Deinococcales bacterium]|nr:type 2 isopentenyl-diphosphate Delta-isomerase [Deinococcales bacterium]